MSLVKSLAIVNFRSNFLRSYAQGLIVEIKLGGKFKLLNFSTSASTVSKSVS